MKNSLDALAFGRHGQPTHTDFAMRLTYRWRHRPTGKAGVAHARFIDRMAYLETLAYWNRSSDEWTYTEEAS